MRITTIILLLILFTKISNAQKCDLIRTVLKETVKCDTTPWALVFADEFDGASLDSIKWKPATGVTRDPDHTMEKEWYSPANIGISNGTLKLTAKRETLKNQCFEIWVNPAMKKFCQDFDITSAEINSKQQFGFGKFEIRCRIPKGKGFFPAFWTFGAPGWNEIDIFEFWNKKNRFGNYSKRKSVRTLHTNIHHDFDGDGRSENCHGSYRGPDFSKEFHVFALIWDAYKTEWYVDGVLKRKTFRYYTDSGKAVDCNELMTGQEYLLNKAFIVQPMHIIANLAIQTGPDMPDAGTPFPSSLEIDYIRYYRRNP